ncbi:hypothetical protein B879_04172 [Cecembia lonarensis LW9]|uniref:Uncharacterized protein n=1 Tax=Cecembia lonarensis (strain CCUG 58316 / KCTC 22772 / LW9) TaxID=1225176 RepID=K1LA06_CECL9|nr:hypothetical protein B879_04172 [Cecembia lonarensis LW9]
MDGKSHGTDHRSRSMCHEELPRVRQLERHHSARSDAKFLKGRGHGPALAAPVRPGGPAAVVVDSRGIALQFQDRLKFFAEREIDGWQLRLSRHYFSFRIYSTDRISIGKWTRRPEPLEDRRVPFPTRCWRFGHAAQFRQRPGSSSVFPHRDANVRGPPLPHCD